MSQRVLNIILAIVILGVLGIVIYFTWVKRTPVAITPGNEVATTTPEAPNEVASTTQYRNTEYGFSVSLPKSWEGYTVIEDKWEGYNFTASGEAQVKYGEGPLISVRHPDWDYKSPRQDIPVMVFTIMQWNDMLAEEFHIGAAPINPSELARNDQYVFALPARYNFAFLTGHEEVSSIIESKAVKAF